LNGFIGVEDVCNEMIVLSEKGISGERFILVSENLNFEEVLQEIARQLGVKGPQLGLSKGVIHLAGRIGSALRKIGIPVPITRDYANSSVARHAYSSEKARQLTGSQYMPMKEVIQQVAEQYLQSQR
jgi:dihydroflavonol-4-reductase